MAKEIMVQAAVALRASIKLTSSIVGATDLLTGNSMLRVSLTDTNATATIVAMRRNLADVMAFLDALEQQAGE